MKTGGGAKPVEPKCEAWRKFLNISSLKSLGGGRLTVVQSLTRFNSGASVKARTAPVVGA